MKTICLLFLSVCVFAQAAVNVVDSVNAEGYEKRLTPVNLKLNAVDEDVFALDQQKLSSGFGIRFIGDILKNLLEGFRDTVINGNDAIPPLDPLEVDHIGPVIVSSTGVRITVNVNNLRAEGLQWYVVNKVDFNTLRLALSLHLTQPWLTVTGSYDATAVLAFLIKHTAGGDFRVFMNRLEVNVDLRLGTNVFGGGHLTLRELGINIDISDLNIKIDGLLGSGVLNGLINDILQNLTQDNLLNKLDELSKTLSEELFAVINDILKDFTLEDLLG